MSNHHKGKTVACTYSPEFRGLVYKINPHDMSCMYKTMFEMCATNTLRDFYDVNRNDDIDSVEPKSSLIIDRPTAVNDFGEWQVCENTHKWFTDNAERMTANGGCNLQSFSSKTTRTQSAFAKLEFHSIKDDRLKQNTSKLVNSAKRKTDAVGSKSFEHRLLSPHLNSINCSGSAEIPYHFHHHNRHQDHMRQYREQYTQRRLKSLRSNINEYRSYPCMLSAPQILQRPTLKPATTNKTSNSASTSIVRCFDVFDSMKDIKARDNSLKSTQKRPIKKIWKSQLAQVPLIQAEINQPVIEVQCHQSGGIRMDDGGGFRRMFTSEDLISSEPETCHRLSPNNAHKLHLHIRSRPSLPSKTLGSKREQPSYVVSYLKK